MIKDTVLILQRLHECLVLARNYNSSSFGNLKNTILGLYGKLGVAGTGADFDIHQSLINLTFSFFTKYKDITKIMFKNKWMQSIKICLKTQQNGNLEAAILVSNVITSLPKKMYCLRGVHKLKTADI
jgi:hypothetical protein